MKIDINEENLTSIITDFDAEIDRLKKVYEEMDSKTEVLNGSDDIWRGKTQESYYEYYKEVSSEFPDIVKEFESHSTFLKKTLENYKREEEQTKKSLDENSENLDVN